MIEKHNQNKEKVNELIKMIEEAEFYYRVASKLSFDLECVAPKDSLEEAGKDLSRVSIEGYKITHSKKFFKLVTELHDDSEGLDEYELRLIKNLYKEKNKIILQT